MKLRKDIIPINPFSHTGIKVHAVLNFVWHWVAKLGGTAEATGSYFERLAEQDPYDDIKDRYASTTFTTDKIEIVQHLPIDAVGHHAGSYNYTEWAKKRYGAKYTSNNPWTPNHLTLSTEICHIDWTGKLEEETLENLIDLSAAVCYRFKLDPIKNIVRHFDITGKDCPKWFVDNPDEFEHAKEKVARNISFRKFMDNRALRKMIGME